MTQTAASYSIVEIIKSDFFSSITIAPRAKPGTAGIVIDEREVKAHLQIQLESHKSGNQTGEESPLLFPLVPERLVTREGKRDRRIKKKK